MIDWAGAIERKTWNRIGLAAVVVPVPGGFVLGAALAARRLRPKDPAASTREPEGR